MPPKRKGYTTEFNLKIIKYAAENNNGAAESLERVRNLSGTGEKQRKLTAMKKKKRSKKANRG